MRQSDFTGYVYHGMCPHCGYYHTAARIEKTSGRKSSGTIAMALRLGQSVFCNNCRRIIEPAGERTYWKPGRGKLSDHYKREAQLVVKDTDWVDYGVLTRLQEHSGIELGRMWEGNFEALCNTLKMEQQDVAELWNWNKKLDRQPTVEDLRQLGVFKYSL